MRIYSRLDSTSAEMLLNASIPQRGNEERVAANPAKLYQ